LTASQIKIADAYNIPSNGPEIGLGEELVSHVVHATDKHDIAVLKPSIDKMKINISGLGAIKHSDAENGYEYWKCVYGLALDALKDNSYDNVKRARIARYKIGMAVDLPDDAGSFTMGLNPYKVTDPAATLEFNPSHFDLTSVPKIAAFWAGIAGDQISFPKLMWSATCSRIDIAFDLLNLRLADLIVHRENLWKVTSFGSYGEGTETLRYYRNSGYLTNFAVKQVKKEKRADVIVYDKRAEQMAHGLTPKFGGLEHTRIEFQVDRKGGKLRTLHSMKFPKKDWFFRRIVSEDAPFDLDRWRLFLDSARFRGYSGAEALLTPDERAQLPTKGNAAFPDDLLVEAMWEHWHDALIRAHVVPLLAWANKEPKDFKF
tara:strand:+ start:3987 stop:5108 length:1122 start_codon:yes stop_codon:yes gene_type:complete